MSRRPQPTAALVDYVLHTSFQQLPASARHATLILLNVPFALVGGVFALLVTGTPLSVSAAIGFIALFGAAVLNGVGMVTGLMPVVGIPLPFFSYGGSSLFGLLVGIGLVMNVSMRRQY